MIPAQYSRISQISATDEISNGFQQFTNDVQRSNLRYAIDAIIRKYIIRTQYYTRNMF